MVRFTYFTSLKRLRKNEQGTKVPKFEGSYSMLLNKFNISIPIKAFPTRRALQSGGIRSGHIELKKDLNLRKEGVYLANAP